MQEYMDETYFADSRPTNNLGPGYTGYLRPKRLHTSVPGNVNDIWRHMKSLPQIEARRPADLENFTKEFYAHAQLPRVRNIELNPLFRGARKFNPRWSSNTLALAVYLTGDEAPRPCHRCETRSGPFVGCVLPKASVGGLISSIACANCRYNWQGTRCTLYARNGVALHRHVTAPQLHVPAPQVHAHRPPLPAHGPHLHAHAPRVNFPQRQVNIAAPRLDNISQARYAFDNGANSNMVARLNVQHFAPPLPSAGPMPATSHTKPTRLRAPIANDDDDDDSVANSSASDDTSRRQELDRDRLAQMDRSFDSFLEQERIEELSEHEELVVIKEEPEENLSETSDIPSNKASIGSSPDFGTPAPQQAPMDWEAAPGIHRIRHGNQPVAFSVAYLSDDDSAIPVHHDVDARLITIPPNERLNLEANGHVYLCFVHSGTVRLVMGGGDGSLTMGTGGMFKVLAGTVTQVENLSQTDLITIHIVVLGG
ncbi:hypothetical protein TruAng_006221 [Truncatella angustata]|nr:hypothetical protein TruAng_006221 [Truncatella angustata]